MCELLHGQEGSNKHVQVTSLQKRARRMSEVAWLPSKNSIATPG